LNKYLKNGNNKILIISEGILAKREIFIKHLSPLQGIRLIIIDAINENAIPKMENKSNI